MPDRFHRPVLGRDLRRRRSERARRGHGAAGERSGAPRRRAWSLLFTPPFDKTRSIPAISRDIRPACAKTAANTRMPRSGRCWRSRSSAKATRRAELFSLLNPINHARHPRRHHRYKVEPYVVAADIYAVAAARRPRRLDLVYGLGGMDVPRRHRRHSWIARSRPVAAFDPCIPATWPGFRIAFRFRSSTYELKVENPKGVNSGIEFCFLDGKTLPNSENGFPLLDDGGAHLISVILGSESIG